MTNEEFQALVLQQLQSINQRIGNLEEGQISLTEGQKSLTEGQARMENRIGNLEEGQARLEKSQDILATEVIALKSKTNGIDTKLTRLAVRIENEIEPKINALFAGHKQHTEQLNRIEEQVNKHDQYILQRIK